MLSEACGCLGAAPTAAQDEQQVQEDAEGRRSDGREVTGDLGEKEKEEGGGMDARVSEVDDVTGGWSEGTLVHWGVET